MLQSNTQIKSNLQIRTKVIFQLNGQIRSITKKHLIAVFSADLFLTTNILSRVFWHLTDTVGPQIFPGQGQTPCRPPPLSSLQLDLCPTVLQRLKLQKDSKISLMCSPQSMALPQLA